MWEVIANVFEGILTTAVTGGLIRLYNRVKSRRKPHLPCHLEFRVSTWAPTVPFILADGVDLESPHRLYTEDIHCREVGSSFELPPDLVPHRETIAKAYSRDSSIELTDGEIARLESFTLMRSGGEELPGLNLALSRLSYFDFICTNLALTPTFKPVVLPAPVLDALNRHRQAISNLNPSFVETLRCRNLGNGLTVHLNIIDKHNNEVFYYLNLDDLATCAAAIVYGDWIPASAVAVVLSLLDKHGYKAVKEALDKPDKQKYKAWLAGTPWGLPRKRTYSILA